MAKLDKQGLNTFIRELDKHINTKINRLDITPKAEKVLMSDGTSVEEVVSANKTSILNNTTLANQALNKANEAFLRGDNVKIQLVDKLISEGLDVSTNNTFEELIGNIALGKKWSSGIYNTVYKLNKEYNYLTETAFPHSTYAQIPYFDFEPSLIILHATYNHSSYISVYMCNSIISTENKVIMASFNRGQASQYNISVKLDNCVDTGSLYEIPTRHNETIKSGYWIAID